MLAEVRINNDPARKWFSDDDNDLIVWYGAPGKIRGFQWCYHKKTREQALTYTEGDGYVHESVDTGEENPLKNNAPVLLPDGACPVGYLQKLLKENTKHLPAAVVEYVKEKLTAYPKK